MTVMRDLFYTQQHEWVKIEDGIAVVGISDHAQELLGEITFVELPEVGLELKAGGELAVVESSKAASDVFAPVSGEVAGVNEELDSSPELINDDCYEKGWICRVKMTNPSDVEGLMDSDEYEAFLATIEE